MLVKSLRLLAAFLFLALAPLPALAADITVFGAASLSDALKDIAADYQTQSGKSVVVSFAASSPWRARSKHRAERTCSSPPIWIGWTISTRRA